MTDLFYLHVDDVIYMELTSVTFEGPHIFKYKMSDRVFGKLHVCPATL